MSFVVQIISVSTGILALVSLLVFAVGVCGLLLRSSRHKPMKTFGVISVAALALTLVFGSISASLNDAPSETATVNSHGQTSGNVAEAGDQDTTVTRAVDGDTVDISPSVEGFSQVRLIGVDTPETHFRTQPYGPEASEFTKRHLEGKNVVLELDVQKRDPYGRLLAYVHLPDARMFNEVLVEEGYAQVTTFPPNVRYVDRFQKAQREARENERGLCSPMRRSASRRTGETGSAADAPGQRIRLRGKRSRMGATANRLISTARTSQPRNKPRGFSRTTLLTRIIWTATMTA